MFANRLSSFHYTKLYLISYKRVFVYHIIQKIDFPIIYTDKSDNIDIKNLQYSVKNIIIDSNLSEKEKMIYLKEIMSDMDNLHQPIEIKYNDIIIGKLHYGDSFLIKKLKIYPYLQFMFMGFFMIIFYLLFNYMKLNLNVRGGKHAYKNRQYLCHK